MVDLGFVQDRFLFFALIQGHLGFVQDHLLFFALIQGQDNNSKEAISDCKILLNMKLFLP